MIGRLRLNTGLIGIHPGREIDYLISFNRIFRIFMVFSSVVFLFFSC